MRVSKAFPSKYLKHQDLGGKAVAVTIKDVEQHTLNGEQLFFKGNEKGLVLNRTNWDLIEETHGDRDDWPGKEIVLAPARTTYQGRRVDCIRVRPPVKTVKFAAIKNSPAAPPPGMETENPGEGLSDPDLEDSPEF